MVYFRYGVWLKLLFLSFTSLNETENYFQLIGYIYILFTHTPYPRLTVLVPASKLEDSDVILTTQGDGTSLLSGMIYHIPHIYAMPNNPFIRVFG